MSGAPCALAALERQLGERTAEVSTEREGAEQARARGRELDGELRGVRATAAAAAAAATAAAAAAAAAAEEERLQSHAAAAAAPARSAPAAAPERAAPAAAPPAHATTKPGTKSAKATKVGQCRLTVSKPSLNAPMVLALEAPIS